MIRILGWALAGILLGGIVHLVTILLLPRVATRGAYARLLPITEPNKLTLLPQPAPNAPLPFLDPAFATAVCRFDVSQGPLKVRTPVSAAYTSITFYTPRGVAFYAITDRAATRRMIDLDLMTAQQRAEVPDDEDTTAGDRLIVETTDTTGLVVLRALAQEPGAIPNMRGLLATAQCTVQPPPS